MLAALTQEAKELGTAIAGVRADLTAITQHEALREVLLHEHRWLQRTEAAVQAAQAWQRAAARQLWSQIVWQWAGLALLALLSSALSVSVYAWITKPDADELAYLRTRLVFVEQLERRMLQMSPAERRQFEVLLKGAAPK